MRNIDEFVGTCSATRARCSLRFHTGSSEGGVPIEEAHLTGVCEAAGVMATPIAGGKRSRRHDVKGERRQQRERFGPWEPEPPTEPRTEWQERPERTEREYDVDSP